MQTNILFIGNDGSSKLTTLKNVIDRKLIIPSYQRPYAWDEDHIEDLFNTVKENSGDSETDNRPAFFGSVIFSTPDQNKYFIIDGQQRVTTFLLVLKVIGEKLTEIQNNLLKKLQVLDHKSDEAEKIRDIKTVKEIFSEKKIIETTSDKCKKLIEKTEGILRRTEISRDSGSSDSENNSYKTENEYINYITGKSIGKSKDFKRNKEKISDKIGNIMEDNDGYENYNRIVNYILNEVRFCLLQIEGEDSEEYAIDVFNTLNSTGEPLTGFEVFKSKLLQICDPSQKEHFERDLFEIEDSIKKEKPNRKDLIIQTGKLLLYISVHRNDYERIELSDKKFKAQYSYIKKTLKTKNKALEMLDDTKKLSRFVVKNWLPKEASNRSYVDHLSSKNSIFALKGFDFLKDINHDRVIPVIYKWSREFLNKEFNQRDYKQIIELCVSFSCLWRMAFDGGARGIDAEYLEIAKKLKNERDILIAQAVIRKKFENKFQDQNVWLDQIINSSIYKNKKITKFLLAMISLKDISRYKTSDWSILPISNDNRSLEYFGNIVLIQKSEEKKFKKDMKSNLIKLSKNDLFNTKIYSNIPPDITEKQIDKRTKILGDLVWKKLFQNILMKSN